jgi:hypothetical protein
MLLKMILQFESPEAMKLNVEIFEPMYFAAVELAEKYGPLLSAYIRQCMHFGIVMF